MGIRRQLHLKWAQGSASRTKSFFKSICLGIAVAGVGLVAVGAPPAQANDEAERSKKSACNGIGQVWWSELITPHPAKVGEFYAKVLGWKLNPVDAQGAPTQPETTSTAYTTFTFNGDEIAGMVKSDASSAIHHVSGWLTYVQVADVDAAATASLNAGGAVVREPHLDTEGNRLALVRDPAGNLLGLIAPLKNGPC